MPHARHVLDRQPVNPGRLALTFFYKIFIAATPLGLAVFRLAISRQADSVKMGYQRCSGLIALWDVLYRDTSICNS